MESPVIKGELPVEQNNEVPATTEAVEEAKPEAAKEDNSNGIVGGREWMDVCGDENSYYRIDNWYPDIEQYTFPTRIANITMQEGLILKKYNEILKQLLIFYELKTPKKRGNVDWEPTPSYYPEVIQECEKGFTADELKCMDTLKDKMEGLIKTVATKEYAFLKLSTRSPKDSAFYTLGMKEMIEADIKNSKASGDTLDSNIEDVIFFVRASCRCLAVKSGEEAIRLFARSRRVLADVTAAELTSNGNEENFSLSLIARDWNPRVLPEWEFRVFIFDNKLTAATQYNSILYVPDMHTKREQIKQHIVDYWEKVKGHIKIGTYTMDLALEPNLEYTYIVELNGPPPSAGVALYNWDDPKDREQIERGTEFELRISESFDPKVLDRIHQPAKKCIHESIFITGL